MKEKENKETVGITNTLLSLMEDFIKLAQKVGSLQEEIRDPEAKLKLQHFYRHLNILEDKFALLVESLERTGVISGKLFMKLQGKIGVGGKNGKE